MPCLVLVLIALAILFGLAVAAKTALVLIGLFFLIFVIGVLGMVTYAVRHW